MPFLPLSKAKLKLFRSLNLKKNRHIHRLFIAEGNKLLNEALNTAPELIEAVILKIGVPGNWENVIANKIFIAEEKEFEVLSSQENPEGVICICRFPDTIHYYSGTEVEKPEIIGKGLILDNVRDPGNLGTIIRTADWFGIKNIICLEGTVDCFNSKTTRSTMGSIFRMNIYYLNNSHDFIEKNIHRVLAADMQGEELQTQNIASDQMILLGNEANGISDEIRSINGLKRVSIPGSGQAESLNVSVAAGIFSWKMYESGITH